MDVVNTTERNIGFEVNSSSSLGLSRFGTPEAAEEDARAELDIQAGRYETFRSAQELVEALQKRIAGKPRKEMEGSRHSRLYCNGTLEPHTHVHLAAPAKPFKVDFFEGGRLIATVSFTGAPDRVVLHEGEGRLWADAEVGRNTFQGMSHAG